jgi:ribokinase
VDVRFVLHSATANTGVGFIILDARGVPAMVTSMGANAELTTQHVDAALSNLRSAKVLLTQFEIPVKVALHAARVGQKFGITTILNPAELQVADILVPNESEAKRLLDIPQDRYQDPYDMAAELKDKSRSKCVIITMGEQGIVGIDDQNTWRAEPPPTEVLDTSGAGDVFCAALAVKILRGYAYKEASEWACRAAALSVTKPGTIPAFPYLDEVIS